MIQNGWPTHLAETQQILKPYFDRRFQLTCQDGVILLQTEYTRVIIPTSLQHTILEMLHEGHWGSSRMKQSARRYVWFPQIDKAIESLCKSCMVCQQTASQPKREYSSWPEATEPWQRLHLDFAGPFCGFMWIILVDAFSKFPYVVKTQSITTETTISVLQKIFAIEGLPQLIVSDNGPQLTSSSFKQFCERNHIKHLTSAPFHPPSNGLAERFVRTFKESFCKIIKDCENKDTALLKYLVTFRSTPNPTTGKSPAELLHGRQPRTLLSAFKPMINKPVADTPPKYLPNQQVYIRKFLGKERWMRGKILRPCGRMMYVIACDQGNVRRHQNQVRLCTDVSFSPRQLEKSDWELDDNNQWKELTNDEVEIEETTEKAIPQSQQPKLAPPTSEAAPRVNTGGSNQPSFLVRRSERRRKPVARYNAF